MAKKKIGIIGSGSVGKTLASGFADKGYAVMIGSRTPGRLEEWRRSLKNDVAAGTFAETAGFGDLLVFAVKGVAAEETFASIDPALLDGKTVLDATNPIESEEPTDGVVRFFTGRDESLLERLQKKAPGARLVKAWNSVGSAGMVDPDFPGGPPTMFICGNEDAARAEARAVLEEFGWEVADMGTARAARAIEPLCILWCIPGFRDNDWNHAFKLLRK
jgi:predicted dinucleotide-binding enzyme